MLAISRKCARRGALTRLPASPARRALSCTSVARRVHTKREDAPPPPPRTASTKGGQSAKKDEGDSAEPERPDFLSTLFPFLAQRSAAIDTALSALVGLSMVFAGGVAYVAWYKRDVLRKIERAFEPGYDPALDLADFPSKPGAPGADGEVELADSPWTAHLRRTEQDLVDRIVRGEELGHYFMLLGAKGSGKGTMLLDAMRAVRADGCAVVECHPDPEVLRLRLGKALDYAYNEDSQTALFQRRDPREGGPALDIERALNKLEKVALKVARRRGRPLVLVFNNVHMVDPGDEGKNLLLQLQQKAEAWSASGIVTMVFSSDDFWPFVHLRKTASRMHTSTISDLSPREALHAAVNLRAAAGRPARAPEVSALRAALALVGGRLAYIGRVARAPDARVAAEHMLDVEKAWLLSQIGLIPDHDDDVMDEQKWSTCTWLLLREFVRMRQAQEEARGEVVPGAGEDNGLAMPAIPYWRCRQIMTRPDFLDQLDRLNIISIDVHHNVRPDSLLVLHAARQVCEEPGFDDVLDGVRARVDEIESLHRTRELTFKDLEDGGRLRMSQGERGEKGWWFDKRKP